MSKQGKILCLFGVTFLLIFFFNSVNSGASDGSKSSHKVTILENDGVSVKKEVSNASDGYEMLLYNDSPYFKITKQDFITEVNRRASEKGYAEGSMAIKVSESFGGIDRVELKMKASNEDAAKMNGDYLYILMDMFSPGMQELIADELGFFLDIPDDKYYAASLICGNTTYSSNIDRSSSLIIKPSKLPETPKVPTAIKPE